MAGFLGNAEAGRGFPIPLWFVGRLNVVAVRVYKQCVIRWVNIYIDVDVNG